MRDVAAAQRDLLKALNALGLQASPDAMDPMRRVDFGQLLKIHDHEEHFLFTTLVASLVTAHHERVKREGGLPSVTKDDFRQALLKLGDAVKQASEQQISTPNKSAVQGACPYC